MGEECSGDKNLLRGWMGKLRSSQVLRAVWATSFLHIEGKHRVVDYLLSSEAENLGVSIWNADRALSLLQEQFPQSVDKTVFLEACVSTWSYTSTIWCCKNTIQKKTSQ